MLIFCWRLWRRLSSRNLGEDHKKRQFEEIQGICELELGWMIRGYENI